MPALTFVTGNAGKLREMQALLAPTGWTVVQDKRGYTEVQAATLADVTEAGADELLAGGLPPPFILEDSGLFVDALQGFPGVFSRHALDTIGVAGLLRLLSGVADDGRGAAFRTDLLLVTGPGPRGRLHFAGECRGRIAREAQGDGGFGFDPVFIPEPVAAGHAGARHEARGLASPTFAQMPAARKDELSHRGQAARALARHLASNQTAKP